MIMMGDDDPDLADEGDEVDALAQEQLMQALQETPYRTILKARRKVEMDKVDDTEGPSRTLAAGHKMQGQSLRSSDRQLSRRPSVLKAMETGAPEEMSSKYKPKRATGALSRLPKARYRDPRFDALGSEAKPDAFVAQKYNFLKDYADEEMNEIRRLLKTKRLSTGHASKDASAAHERESLIKTLRKMEQEKERAKTLQLQKTALQSAKQVAWQKGAYLKKGQQRDIGEQARLQQKGVLSGSSGILEDIELEKGSTKKMVERKRRKEFAKEARSGKIPIRRG